MVCMGISLQKFHRREQRNREEAAEIFFFYDFFYFLESKNLYGGVEKRILAGLDRRGRKLVNRLCMDHLWLSFSTSALLVF